MRRIGLENWRTPARFFFYGEDTDSDSERCSGLGSIESAFSTDTKIFQTRMMDIRLGLKNEMHISYFLGDAGIYHRVRPIFINVKLRCGYLA